MKLVYLITISTLLLFSICTQAQISQITPQELYNKIESGQPIVILDVRTAQEFSQGHIQGAVNIPYDQLHSHKKKLNAYKANAIVVYCRSGRRAEIAQQTLHDLGFTQLIDLKGHINLWQALNLPLLSGSFLH
ncbi:rhodanese-like domain-containing protein [Psychromonas antarctica]|uniref:rhodanese-like domain-containing protein n=1 Tax=Psychromonas antarctica TaxID=67573 RepID=UPI001EE7AE49|nr:rhodanese-like domain-containing protein [Psychromonas antarctica]MCG6201951.1 rhodanese-like domain-containing protein [Psychromonas antarctica]